MTTPSQGPNLGQTQNTPFVQATFGTAPSLSTPRIVTQAQIRKMHASQAADREERDFPARQMRYYGADLWAQQFVRLGDIESFPGATIDGQKLRDKIWDSFQSSPAKRFQECFCAPENYAVPRFSICKFGSSNNVVTFLNPKIFIETGLRPTLISAERLPRELVDALGIKNFSQFKGRPDDLRIAKCELIIAEAVKAIWESAQPLEKVIVNNRDKTGQRIWVVQKISDGVRSRYDSLANYQIPDRLEGALLYTRGTENSASKKQICQLFSDGVYDGLRKTNHQERIQLEEALVIGRLKAIGQTVQTRLDKLWNQGTAEEKEQLRSASKQQLIELAMEFYGDVNPNKERIFDRLTSASTLSDSKGRVNSSATLTRLTSALDAADRRITEVQAIDGFNTRDANALNSAVTQAEPALRNYRRGIVNFANDVERILARPNPDSAVIEHDLFHSNLKFLSVRPFLPFKHAFEDCLCKLNPELRARDRETTETVLLGMHVIGKLSAAVVCLGELRAVLTQSQEDIAKSTLNKYLGKLSEIFQNREIFPDKNLVPLERIYAPIQEKITEAKDVLLATIDRDPSTLREDLRELLDHQFKRLDFDKVLDELKQAI